MENVSADVPVLIVGGGPTGLFTAYMLSKHGVKSLLIEKYPQRLAAPKAHALLGSPRDDAFWVNFLTNLSGERIGYLPYERMDAEVLENTPEMIHNVPQPDFERFVAEQLVFDSNVELRKGIAFVCCKQHGDKVVTTVEERSSKKRWNITSNFVIACDGAKSQVRKSLNIQTEGEDGYETMMTIHFNADLRPVVRERVGMLHWVMDPACSGLIIAYDLGGNQVLISNFDPKKHPAEAWSEELARATVTAAIGQDIPFKVLSFRPWVLSRKVAKEYRRGNTFLLGDAAHSFPPTGGLGLNSGLADAHNLVYKIAAVYQGWAKPSLLDTYEAERQPIALVASSQSVENGKTVFSFLKAIGTADIDDVEEARRNMYRTIRDPAKQDLIAERVEGQREHFDNLEIHIGYVYGDARPPANASHYTPKFKVGARLPHAWINILTPNDRLPQKCIDTSYVKELSKDQVLARQFSMLDLVVPGGFSLIVECRDLWIQRFKEFEEALSGRIGRRLYFWAEGTDFEFSNECHRRLFHKQGRLAQGGALLVRPDQHLLGCLGPEASAHDLISLVMNHLGFKE
ncbi:2, 4-dichlorophenol 6-monooxygenase [Colletotrichum karsti]|uniref:2, 4-dichlorophenol 6-monooxygenase n=1 Tax=Colletotrichum karsti TaxID=1095194 RepID=A0A9P6HY51_9PEZI|nr:2, 4-dichlorophenol 6-monooxygenase [Colletotrichum karsti]KAF9870471.1 2, 4-dichlorophenol 6-monooxygenase [Colletotrichum karsti]